MSYSRDSGAPAYGDANTNIRVDFVYGNMPIQPNEDREQPGLSVMDSHTIAATEWNFYPVTETDETNTVVYSYGKTLEGGDAFYWPALGYCNGVYGEQAKVSHFFDYLRDIGVDPDYLKDFTFSGGETEWDSNGEPNWDGCVFYSYIPEDVVFGETAQGTPIYGSDVDGEIIYGNWATNTEVSIDGSPEDFAVIVFSNDPRKNNAGWWGF
jgi:hypothetical protein